MSHLEALVASKTVTLPLLLHIAPPLTPDPTPHLYDGAFYIHVLKRHWLSGANGEVLQP